MHKKRLKQLRRVVAAAPDDRLHMARWCETADCGTAYCAAGWAAVDPWFRENTEIGTIFGVRDDGTIYPNSLVWRPLSALARLFAISIHASCHLFGNVPCSADPHAVTKAMVLANIDLILAGKPAQHYGTMKEEPCTKNA